MDISFIQNICYTSLLVTSVALLITKAFEPDDFGPWIALIILASFFGGSIASIITMLILIWAN